MGAPRSQAQNHPGRGARAGHPGAQGDRRQPGPRGQIAWHYARHAAQTRREIWDSPGTEHQVSDPSLLLLIPAYNEEHRIEPVLREYARYFQEQYRGKFQLVVVLNGCRDNTIGVVRRVAAEDPAISALEVGAPIGKGGALIEGFKLAPPADGVGLVGPDGA